MTTPYTYLIGWPEHNTWYYGVRWRPNCDPSDLWTKYFTSSKYVKLFRQEHGEPSVIQIRQTFVEPAKARDWEHKVLKRMKADVNPLFLNKTIDNVPTMQGRKHSEETKLRMSASQKGKPKKPESIARQVKTMTGRKLSEAQCKAISEGHKGIPKSDECKAKLVAIRSGTFWWTNGVITKAGRECPGEGWYRGRQYKQKGLPKEPS